MFKEKEFPILEFDSNRKAKIEPSNVITKLNKTEYCVITFFGDVISEMLKEGKWKQLHFLQYQNSVM